MKKYVLVKKIPRMDITKPQFDYHSWVIAYYALGYNLDKQGEILETELREAQKTEDYSKPNERILSNLVNKTDIWKVIMNDEESKSLLIKALLA